MNPSPSTDTFLLVVDMQPAFFPVIPGAEQIVKRCTLALASASGLGLGVGFTEQVPAKLGPTSATLRAAAPDAPVWGKTAFSALGETAVRAALQERGVRRLLLAGIETPVCVYQTATDALASGFDVTILCDAIGGRRPDDAAPVLAELTRRGVRLLPVEAVFYRRLRDASHPFFREYTRLVKQHG